MKKPIFSLSTSTVIVDWKSNKNIYYIVDCMGLSSTRFQLYCVDQVLLLLKKQDYMGKNTTNHPQVTDHGEKYHWPPLSYWPWGKIPLTSLKLLTMGENTTDHPQVTDKRYQLL